MKFWKVVVKVKAITPVELYAKMGRLRMQKAMERNCVFCCEQIQSPQLLKCIECTDAEIFFCLQCFQLGAESGDHKRDHNYVILDETGPPVFDWKKANGKRWGYYEDLALLEAALEYNLDDEWSNIFMDKFGKVLTKDEALAHLDRYFLRGKIGQHILSGIKCDMTGNTEKAQAIIAQPINFPPSKYSEIVTLIRNCDSDDMPSTSQKNWFQQLEQMKNEQIFVKPKKFIPEKDEDERGSSSPVLRPRRLSSRSAIEEFNGVIGNRKSSLEMDLMTPDEVQYKHKMRHDLHKRDWKKIEKLLISQGFIRHCPEIVQLFRSYIPSTSKIGTIGHDLSLEFCGEKLADDDAHEFSFDQYKVEPSETCALSPDGTINRRLSYNSTETMPSTRILRPRTQTSMHSPGSLSRTPTRYSNRLSGRAETDRRIAMMSKPVDDDDSIEIEYFDEDPNSVKKYPKFTLRSSLRSQSRRVTLASNTSEQTSTKESEPEDSEMESDTKVLKPKMTATRTQKSTPKKKKKPSPLSLNQPPIKQSKNVKAKRNLDTFLFTKEEMLELRAKYPDPYFYSHGQPYLDEDAIAKLKQDDLNLIGYMPKRDDFEEECNWDAEKLISRMTICGDPNYPRSKDEELMNEAKFILLDRYNRMLRKRMAKHGVLREHELVNEFFSIVKNNPSERGKYSFLDDVPLLNQKKREFYAPLFGRAHQVLDKALIDELIKNVAKADFLMDRIEMLQKLQREGGTKLPVRLKFDTPAIAARTGKKKRKRTRYSQYQLNRKANLRWQRIKRWQKKMNEADPEELEEFDE